MNAPLTTQSPLEALVCKALAQARAVLPVLRGVIAEQLFGDPRAQALAIADSIERRDIFKSCVSWDLNDLLYTLDAEIEDMIVRITMWSDHDCDVTGNTWVETMWSPEAVVLAAARIDLTALCEAIDAVNDQLDLESILAGRWQFTGTASAPQT